MLLANWEDHHATLRQALRRRFGGKAWLAHGGILACAVAAIVKPVLFGPSLLYLNRVAPGLVLLRWSALIDWLSFLFEYLFGVCVQIYLILLVYAWLRGLNWTPAHLMDMAIRRFSFVVKWAAVVMAASSLLIDLPRIGALLFRFDDPVFLNQTFAYIDGVGRPLLALFLISFSTMQITLTFHSETLRKAFRPALPFRAAFLVAAPLVSARGRHSSFRARAAQWLAAAWFRRGDGRGARLEFSLPDPVGAGGRLAARLLGFAFQALRNRARAIAGLDSVLAVAPDARGLPLPLLRAADLFHHRTASPEVTLDLRGAALDFAARSFTLISGCARLGRGAAPAHARPAGAAAGGRGVPDGAGGGPAG